MALNELIINGKDAYSEWGISLDDKALSALLTPAPCKDYITINTRISDGEMLVPVATKVASRRLTLTLNLVAPNREAFFTQFDNFVAELQGGKLDIQTIYQRGVIYHCYYVDCQQFAQYSQGIGKFALTLIEPNPTKRI